MENLEELKSLEILSKSLNSNIYKIEYKNKNAIIKRYKSKDKMRLNREFSALNLLNKSSFQYVPKILEINRKENHIIMSKLEGISAKQDLNFTIELANHINGMQNYINKKESLEACDAAFNLKDHFKLVENKIIYILKKIDFNSQELKETKKMIDEILKWIKDYKKMIFSNFNVEENINLEKMIFSQSDIGAHNSIIYRNHIYTFDYEYAGLDDPSKTFCDLLIHPESKVSVDKFTYLVKKIESIEIFKDSNERNLILIPIYRYKWFAIILNSFLKNKDNYDNEKSLEIIKKSKFYLKQSFLKISKLDLIKKINL